MLLGLHLGSLQDTTGPRSPSRKNDNQMVQANGASGGPFRDRLWFPLHKFPTQRHFKDPSLSG